MSKEICILNGTKWILGDESTELMNWEDANNWCKSIGQDLPPREVLLMAFLNPEIRSKFANGYYWSSSEFDSYSAWDQDFNIGDQNVNFSKSAKLSVRAVRAIIAEASEQTEPVAWIIQTEVEGKLLEWVCTDKKHYMEEHDSIKEPIPLYLAPKREQGLREDLREGISFCDHFAGLAMQGLLNGVDNYTMSTKATWAYNMADAMLMERSKRDEQR